MASLLDSNHLERINRITLWIIQLQPRAIIKRQTILLRVVQSASPLSPTPQLDFAGALCALDPEADVDAPVYLVDIALDPRVLGRKIYFIAELLAHERIGAQSVQRRRYD